MCASKRSPTSPCVEWRRFFSAVNMPTTCRRRVIKAVSSASCSLRSGRTSGRTAWANQANIRASSLSVLANWPVARANARTRVGLTTATGKFAKANSATRDISHPPLASRTTKVGANSVNVCDDCKNTLVIICILHDFFAVSIQPHQAGSWIRRCRRRSLQSWLSFVPPGIMKLALTSEIRTLGSKQLFGLHLIRTRRSELRIGLSDLMTIDLPCPFHVIIPGFLDTNDTAAASVRSCCGRILGCLTDCSPNRNAPEMQPEPFAYLFCKPQPRVGGARYFNFFSFRFILTPQKTDPLNSRPAAQIFPRKTLNE